MNDYLPALEALAEDFFYFGFMFIITLMIVIVVHEFGHYIAARICNVHVKTFAFGFGKELFGFGGGQLNKTRWSICAFPIGGYVEIFGDVDKNNPLVWDKENDCERRLTAQELEVSFCTKNVWQRIFIISAGPAINLLLAFLIFFITFSTYGQRSKPLNINAIAVNSPAHEAGFQIDDIFIEMDGNKIRRLDDIYDKTWHETPAIEHEYKILRAGEVITTKLTARRAKYMSEKGVAQDHGQTGMLRLNGINFKEIASVDGIDTYKQPDKARELLLQNFDKEIIIGLIFKAKTNNKPDNFITYFASDFNAHLSNPNDFNYDKIYLSDPKKSFYVRLPILESAKTSLVLIKKVAVDSYKLLEASYNGRNDDAVIGGISKISGYSAKSAKSGVYSYVLFVAGFSLMIAFVNLLPIPALDGGYLVFLIYEVIAGKPASPQFQSIAMIIGLVLLGGIMIFANASDLISMLNDVKSN